MRRSVLLAALVFVFPMKADAKSEWHLGKWDPGVHNVKNAIYYEFCGHRYRYCELGDEAVRVSYCETGGTFNIWAGVGRHDYWGLFQMGHRERALYGYGNNPWQQAAGAKRYYDLARWGPWTCQP